MFLVLLVRPTKFTNAGGVNGMRNILIGNHSTRNIMFVSFRLNICFTRLFP